MKQIYLQMKKCYLLSLLSAFFMFSFALKSTGQSIKKDEAKHRTAKVQQTTEVSIFQVNFKNVDENLQTFLTKNEDVLHFRGETNANANVYVIYLRTGNSKTDLIALLKTNGIRQFEIMKSQQGAAKSSLFNKRF